jgi:YHS domain-containing protein
VWGAVALALTLGVAAGADTPVAAVNAEGGVALQGYDPVAYFTTGAATLGVSTHAYQWMGVTYYFASADNRERFQTAPDAYLPQYGGYCAYAMSLNRIADVDPARWAIVDGKLYLNNNRFAHTLWSLSKNGNIAAADQNWAVFPKTGTAH